MAERVVTQMTFDATPEEVWRGLVFYEQLRVRPPAHLRWLLPVPIGTEGSASAVGDLAKCVYERGHLVKRITRLERPGVYEFEVAEQSLSFGAGLQLRGGRYALRELPDGRTEVGLETGYLSTRWPRWLWRPLERLVCHWFHRYLLAAMRRTIEST